MPSFLACLSPSSSVSSQVVVAPPSLFTSQVQEALKDSAVQVASQDSSVQQGYGAYTGELSPKMIKVKTFRRSTQIPLYLIPSISLHM